MRTWAGSGKLTKKQLEQCRKARDYERVAERIGVCKETVARVAKGRSWKEGWKPRSLNDKMEVKRCEVCDKQFSRRYPNGRRRTPAIWENKRTCSYSCCITLNWREGVYANR
jgi:hypothetical protein